MEGKQFHFVLVHGASGGAWNWHKLKTRLESSSGSGNKVTILDLAASGINLKKMEDVKSFAEYSEPLLEFLESLPENEKVVLVGHSFGGLSIALAMDKFPHKIAVGIFVAAFLPDTKNPPSYVLEKHIEIDHPNDSEWLGTEISSDGSITFGSEFRSQKVFQLCSPEELELAKILSRPGCLFLEELSKAKSFSKEGYGSVPIAYIMCDEDLAIPVHFQKWMIQNASVNEVLEINGSDHMPMLCQPHQLLLALLKIANNHI